MSESRSVPAWSDLAFGNSSPRRLLAAGFALAAVTVAVACWHHAMWLDEAQAWLIARDSRDLADLHRNLRYEGHPGLWYLLLYGATRLTADPLAMKLINLGFILASAVLLLRARALPLILRLGAVFSYYMIYEYGTLSRSYGMSCCVLFAIMTLLADQRIATSRIRQAGAYALFLILPQSDVPPAIIGAFLFPYFLYRLSGSDPGALLAGDRRSWVRNLALAAGFAASNLLVIWMILPPADSEYLVNAFAAGPGGAGAVQGHWWQALALAGRYFTAGYFPLPLLGRHFWNLNILWTSPTGFAASALLGWVAFLLLPRLLALGAAARLYFYSSGATLLLACTFVFSSYARHWGFFFVALILALWLDGVEAAPAGRPSGPARRLVLAALCLSQVVGAAWALGMEARYPFTATAKVAAYLQQAGLAGAPLLGDHRLCATVAYLQRPAVYYLEGGRPGSFLVWDKAYLVEAPLTPQLLRERHGTSPQPVVVVLGYALTAAELQALGLVALTSFTGSIAREDFYLYAQTVS